MNRVLIVEDDADVARGLERTLRALECVTQVASSAAEALAEFEHGVVDVVLLDLGLPDRSGLATLDAVMERDPTARVIVVSGTNDAMLAVAALQRGAVDYVVKPWDRETLLRVVRRALDEARLRREVEAARAQLARSEPDAVGSSARWRSVLEDLRAAAETGRAPVLVCGESGTGKDVAATLVHRWSPRASGPFVTLNAACLPESTIESELFGHESGAFTGARTARRGLFELAHGGTLFLDEIGELPLELQPRLLRVLEGHPFRRLGGEREIRTDVRLVAATNRSLPEMIRQGRFREDLYYRLRVLEFHLPPLREREGDVRELALYFVGRIAREMGRPDASLDARALDCLAHYDWPGNARELRNVIERALVLARGGIVSETHLPDGVRARASAVPPEPAVIDTSKPVRAKTPVAPVPLALEPGEDVSLDAAVRRHVLAVYAQHGGNLSRTAAALGITRVALRRRLRESGAYDGPGARTTAPRAPREDTRSDASARTAPHAPGSSPDAGPRAPTR